MSFYWETNHVRAYGGWKGLVPCHIDQTQGFVIYFHRTLQSQASCLPVKHSLNVSGSVTYLCLYSSLVLVLEFPLLPCESVVFSNFCYFLLPNSSFFQVLRLQYCWKYVLPWLWVCSFMALPCPPVPNVCLNQVWACCVSGHGALGLQAYTWQDIWN